MINIIQNQCNCQIRFYSIRGKDIVLIKGTKDKCKAAKAMVLAIVDPVALPSITMELNCDKQHAFKLIGEKRDNLKELIVKFKGQIRINVDVEEGCVQIEGTDQN